LFSFLFHFEYTIFRLQTWISSLFSLNCGFGSHSGYWSVWVGVFVWSLSPKQDIQSRSDKYPSYWRLQNLCQPLNLKRTEREAHHSHPSSGNVRNVWSYTSTPRIILNRVVLN
jgi:hypothetical protein